MQLFTINWNGSIQLSGDTNSWDAAAIGCFFSRPQFVTFNATPPSSQPLKVTGNPASTADPSNDGNRRATGQVAGVVFGG